MEIQKIGVIGAGNIGSSVATDLSSFGYKVILHDIAPSNLIGAQTRVVENFEQIKLLGKQTLVADVEEILNNITFTNDLTIISETHFIIENITEIWSEKKALYDNLNNINLEDKIIAINTSCIPITQVAQCLKRPEKVVGMHFMNPVPLMKLVEIVRGYYTNDETLTVCKNLLKSLSKTSIVVNDAPGFVSNRLSHILMNEAAFVVQENVASAADVDKLFRVGYGHKMGPLETADLIGLDTVVNSLHVLYENFQDPKFKCCQLLKKMVAAGILGRKTGKGFYEYD